jgi:hypothetical protein
MSLAKIHACDAVPALHTDGTHIAIDAAMIARQRVKIVFVVFRCDVVLRWFGAHREKKLREISSLWCLPHLVTIGL